MGVRVHHGESGHKERDTDKQDADEQLPRGFEFDSHKQESITEFPDVNPLFRGLIDTISFYFFVSFLSLVSQSLTSEACFNRGELPNSRQC